MYLLLLISFILRLWCFIQKKISSYSDSTYSLGLATLPSSLLFLPASPKFFFLYFSLFACFPHLHDSSCFSPSYMPGWNKINSMRWRYLSSCHFLYLRFFLSVGMLPRNLVIPWKTQVMACNSVIAISIIPHCFLNLAISICSHIKWNWWPVWRPDSGGCTLLTAQHPSCGGLNEGGNKVRTCWMGMGQVGRWGSRW